MAYRDRVRGEYFLFPDASVGWERYFHRNNDPLELATISVLWVSLLVGSIVVPILLRS